MFFIKSFFKGLSPNQSTSSPKQSSSSPKQSSSLPKQLFLAQSANPEQATILQPARQAPESAGWSASSVIDERYSAQQLSPLIPQDDRMGRARHGEGTLPPTASVASLPDGSAYASNGARQSLESGPATRKRPRNKETLKFVHEDGQRRRPRKRPEEIERYYKCGWHGCVKGYGMLHHLNAHVTSKKHGSKRTPEEFSDIRAMVKRVNPAGRHQKDQ